MTLAENSGVAKGKTFHTSDLFKGPKQFWLGEAQRGSFFFFHALPKMSLFGVVLNITQKGP